ncbi:sulfurtransferase [Agromyces mariniharenae]|uniref:Sulfurtransferase n=1 Tax=Agromyces mariniharenae TaxID=2604423 RepID=A0A5S4UYJ0_9MICO|nr:rhodanese-like domain-containing protein [Agromyces mariniharenae]TYL50201.1 sulfurtransferase [Agromyces mariniharenae]
MPALDLPTDLVSTEWLAAHLGDSGLVVVDASVLGTETPAGFRWLSGLDEYLIEGHIPGAVFGDLLEELSDPEGPFSFTRPEPARLERAARDLGIDDGVAVVVYDSSIGQWAARLWWILASAGVERVAVLDGGLARWRAEGRTLETGFEAPREAGSLTLSPREGFWADGPEVQRIVAGESDAALVCALPPSDFRGETGRRARRGHIPGSVNVPVGSVVDRETRTLLRGAELDARLAAATEGDPSRVVVYCGAGIAAAGTGFALRRAGHADVAIYDGSLDEWTADPAAPLVTIA